jgi:hypothetical protein
VPEHDVKISVLKATRLNRQMILHTNTKTSVAWVRATAACRWN